MTPLDLVTLFWQTKYVTKSGLHCTSASIASIASTLPIGNLASSFSLCSFIKFVSLVTRALMMSPLVASRISALKKEKNFSFRHWHLINTLEIKTLGLLLEFEIWLCLHNYVTSVTQKGWVGDKDWFIERTVHTGSFHKYHNDGLQQAVFIKKVVNFLTQTA